MKRTTITVDEKTLVKARMRALQEDSSMGKALEKYLKEYAKRRTDQLDVARRIVKDARHGVTSSSSCKIKREDSYEERLAKYPGNYSLLLGKDRGRHAVNRELLARTGV